MCGQSESIRLTSRSNSGKIYYLAVCRQCGQHYCDPTPTAAEIVEFYQGDYHQELRQIGSTEKIFGSKFLSYRDWVVKYLESGRTIDVGTATGLFPSILKEAGFDAEGLEYNRASAEWGAKNYGIRIRVGGLEQIAAELETYDLISMTDVLEHTEHPLRALQTASRSLKPHGFMLITFPNIRSAESTYLRILAKLTKRNEVWTCCHIPLHVWEFTRETAQAMFEKAGFEVVGFRRSHSAVNPTSIIAGLLFLPLQVLKFPPLARAFGTQMEFMIRKRV